MRNFVVCAIFSAAPLLEPDGLARHIENVGRPPRAPSGTGPVELGAVALPGPVRLDCCFAHGGSGCVIRKRKFDQPSSTWLLSTYS